MYCLAGEYFYAAENGTSPAVQYFPVQNNLIAFFSMVELKITSNHGNQRYTCVYRFRVHGNLMPVKR